MTTRLGTLKRQIDFINIFEVEQRRKKQAHGAAAALLTDFSIECPPSGLDEHAHEPLFHLLLHSGAAGEAKGKDVKVNAKATKEGKIAVEVHGIWSTYESIGQAAFRAGLAVH